MAVTTTDVPTGPNIGPNDHVMGMPTFDVPASTFRKVLGAKRKNKRWMTYLESNPESDNVRQWANKNHSKPIMLRNRDNPTEHIRAR